MISGDCQSARFDELLSFEKERQKTRARVFVFGTSTRSFESKAMAKIMLARSTILGFRVD